MAYYRLSKVVKMRREAMGHERCEYDVEGPSGMTVLRLEQGKVRVKESTYRRLSKAMGQEESTRQGILQTNDFSELLLVNKISNAFLKKDNEQAEKLIELLEQNLDDTMQRNKQYLNFIKAKIQYREGKMTGEEYETILKDNITYGTLDYDTMTSNVWPFYQREWSLLMNIVNVVRKKEDYIQQKKLLEQLQSTLNTGYMDAEYTAAYKIWIRLFISDVFGNTGCYREALRIDEETLLLCEERQEFRYLAEIHFSIFLNYWMLKKKETLTEEEKSRSKECLLRAYYIDRACCSAPNKFYERCVRELYPEELEDCV